MSDIQDYVKKAKAAGLSEAQIRTNLQGAGWSTEDINQALSAPSIPEPPAAKPAAPSQTEKKQSVHEPQQKKGRNTLSVIAFIVSLFMPLIGLILGIIALRQINKSGEKGKGFAIAAIVIGLLSFVVVFFLFVPMLAYFGVLDPANLLPERCQFPAGMDCIDRAAITSDTITLALRNNIGVAISVDDVESSCTGALIAAQTGDFQELPMEVENNAAYRIRLTGCSNGRSGSEVTEDIGVVYENPDTGLTNTAQGEVRGRVV